MNPLRRRRILLGVSAKYDADFQAVLSAGSGAGYTLPSANTQDQGNTFLLALKAGGIWDKLDLLYVFATDGDSNFACINWKNPGQFTVSKVNSPIFTSKQGFKGDTVSAYLNTGFTPSSNGVNYKLNDAGRFMWIKQAGTLFFGEGNLTDATNDLIAFANSSIKRINGGSVAANIDFSATGLFGLYRTSSTAVSGFTNLTRVDTTASSASLPPFAKTLLAATSNRTDQLFAIYGLGAGLANEHTALYNACNTYLTSI